MRRVRAAARGRRTARCAGSACRRRPMRSSSTPSGMLSARPWSASIASAAGAGAVARSKDDVSRPSPTLADERLDRAREIAELRPPRVVPEPLDLGRPGLVRLGEAGVAARRSSGSRRPPTPPRPSCSHRIPEMWSASMWLTTTRSMRLVRRRRAPAGPARSASGSVPLRPPSISAWWPSLEVSSRQSPSPAKKTLQLHAGSSCAALVLGGLLDAGGGIDHAEPGVVAPREVVAGERRATCCA